MLTIAHPFPRCSSFPNGANKQLNGNRQQLQFQQQQQGYLIKRQQALIQDSIHQQQANLYHPALLSAQNQAISTEPLPSRTSSASCSTVYVGNVHRKVTPARLADIFSTIGPLSGCKLIRKEKSSYGFVDYRVPQAAAAAILTLNGMQIYNRPLKVNWAYMNREEEYTKEHYKIFVGDLSADVTDFTLLSFFSVYPSCLDAHVICDHRTGCSRGFGFVSFTSKQDAETAIKEKSGELLGNKVICCDWETKSRICNASN